MYYKLGFFYDVFYTNLSEKNYGAVIHRFSLKYMMYVYFVLGNHNITRDAIFGK